MAWTDVLAQAMHYCFDLLFAASRSALYVTSLTLAAVACVSGAHVVITKVRKEMAGVGLVSYLMLLFTFSVTVFRHLRDFVRPVSGFVAYDDGWTADSCDYMAKNGPAHILATQFICNSMLLTPVLLLPPGPGVANAFVHRIEKVMGVDMLSKASARLKSFSTPVLHAYILGCAWTLLHTFSVYSFADQYLAQLPTGPGDDSPAAAAPVQAPRSDEPAGPAMFAFAYVLLAMTKLIIVYERLTNRSFHEDFPTVMLMRAFPFLKGWSSVVGKLAAQASRLGKLDEYAEKAYVVIRTAPAQVEEMRSIIEETFDEAEVRLVAQMEHQIAMMGDKYIAQAVTAIEPKVVEAVVGAIHDICHRFGDAKKDPTRSPPTAKLPALWCAIPGRSQPAADLGGRGSRDLEAAGPGAARRPGAGGESVADFFRLARGLLVDLHAPEELLAQGQLPGDSDFEVKLTKMAKESLEHFFASLKKESHHYTELGSEWAGKWLTERVREVVAHYKPLVMAGMDAFLKELKELALKSDHLHSDIEQAYSKIRKLATQTVPEDLRFTEAEAERLVDAAAQLPFVQGAAWTWAYYLLGLGIFAGVANFSASTISAVVLMREGWTTMQKVESFLLVVPFAGLFAFVVYFWFMASTGQIFARRGGRPLVRSRPVHMYSPLTGRLEEQDEDVAHDKGASDCLSMLGVVVPLLGALGASAMLVYQFVGAMRTPMYEKCTALLQ